MDVSLAMRVGRRRLRARRARTTVIAGVTVLAVAATPTVLANLGPHDITNVVPSATSAAPEPPPPIPTTCTPEPLALPAGISHGDVTGGDPTGRYLVGILEGGRPVLWAQGNVEPVAPPFPGAVTRLAVNSSGAAREWVPRPKITNREDLLREADKLRASPRPQPRQEPLYWSPDGSVHQLPIPAGYGPGAPVAQRRRPRRLVPQHHQRRRPHHRRLRGQLRPIVNRPSHPHPLDLLVTQHP